jgi:hypothetical protein
MVGHESVGMQRHAIAVAIALEALQIGAGVRVVMEDRGTAIPVDEDMIKPAGDVEAWLAGKLTDFPIGAIICPAQSTDWRSIQRMGTAIALLQQ